MKVGQVKVNLFYAISGPLFLIGLLGIGGFWRWFSAVPDPPVVHLGYWGPAPFKPDDFQIIPFTVNISQKDLNDLRKRLDNTRELTEPLEGLGFTYGFNTTYLNRIIRFWRDEYNWSERQDFLNKFPQFRTRIGGINIHFIHIKPDLTKLKGKKVVPVIFLHGWPGSIREFYEAIPMLTGQKEMPDVALELVIPSLPGYGWSDAPRRRGLGPAEAATIFKELMIRLGHERFFVHGGDWGAVIGSTMTTLYPKNVMAYHSNLCYNLGKFVFAHMAIASIIPSWVLEESLVDKIVQIIFTVGVEESGYFHIQATKPDTVGVGLSDSPAGLAAYILEKFSTWTNTEWRNLPDGGLENWDKTKLLDNLMIYWFSKSITTSMRFYADATRSEHTLLSLENIPTYIPTACVRFGNDLGFFPELSVRAKYRNLIQITEYPEGGHFAAFEVPNLLTKDLTKFIRRILSENEEEKK